MSHHDLRSCCSDVICEFPLREMLAFHKQSGAEGTILVTKVRGSSGTARDTAGQPNPDRGCASCRAACWVAQLSCGKAGCSRAPLALPAQHGPLTTAYALVKPPSRTVITLSASHFGEVAQSAACYALCQAGCVAAYYRWRTPASTA